MSASIILVQPEGPDNIGAAARAMKNMGLSDLRLVRPPSGWKKKARKMAVAAAGLLAAARVFDSVAGAVSDCQLVFGTSRRRGAKRGMFVDFTAAVEKIRSASRKNRTAILFGRESRGLSNADLELCDFLFTLPASAEYPSLNLAQAVMVVSFSLFSAEARRAAPGPQPPLVSKEETGEVLDRLRQALEALGYEDGRSRVLPRILAAFRDFFSRGGLLQKEAQMFRGLSRRIIERING